MTGFVTGGGGSEDVLNVQAHEGIDHTAGPLSLLDASAHDAIDHASLSTPLMTVAAHNALDHTTEAGTNVNPTQVSPAERTAGTEGNLRSFSPFDVASMAGTHGGGSLPAATYGQQSVGHTVGADGPVSLNLTSQSGSWRFVQCDSTRANAINTGTLVGWKVNNFVGHNTGALQLNGTEAKGGFANQFISIFVSTLSPAQT